MTTQDVIELPRAMIGMLKRALVPAGSLIYGKEEKSTATLGMLALIYRLG